MSQRYTRKEYPGQRHPHPRTKTHLVPTRRSGRHTPRDELAQGTHTLVLRLGACVIVCCDVVMRFDVVFELKGRSVSVLSIIYPDNFQNKDKKNTFLSFFVFFLKDTRMQ